MTAADALLTHDWRVVAPWWHWPRLGGVPAPGEEAQRRAVRLQAPVLQKYDGPDLVNTFLSDPQRRLEFIDDSDRVATLSEKRPGGLPQRTTAGGIRKLYLPTHHRHYLVVCALHCDAAGFPRARADDVCEAGFVVRRRTADLPGGPDGEAATRLRHWARARGRARIAERRLLGETGLRRNLLQHRLSALAEAERAARERVREVAQEAGAPTRTLSGWIPAGVDAAGVPGPMPACGDSGAAGTRTPLTGVGSWTPVEELPEHLAEAAYPLASVLADPARPGSDAALQTLYFGVVPTGSGDIDTTGGPRFDDGDDYEIRCFARRHRPECPRDGGHCLCPIFWSEPTEPYRLAGHFDLEGCAHRPATVQLPDLAQLKADALRLGPGGAGGLRFRSPPGSALAFRTEDLKAVRKEPPNAFPQVCSFAVPLITIVAFFVLQLFLPIVVLVFQLWWMLALRFCLPPDVPLGQDLIDDFERLGDGLDINGTVAAAVVNRPTFVKAMADLLDDLEPQNRPLGQEIREAHGKGGIDAATYAVLGRAALAQEAGQHPRVFAARVERNEVVTP
ncbi:hypothetical protein FXF51_20315 [Nonomuraea sp. PA05]|uniref:hypothetical protein n=1 Tax=Nonomuraea sp. PA05 TaxID=2604466 RepID=UPI0011D4C36A|nr:hypothetical protein [Nonomuraea sp. PA05]TYB64800.1 hypothetical protein FXF51_20315 [Nonomuraea sp. PA05]